MTRRVLLEVCVASAEDARAAAAGGADRLEVSAALALGGLTPSAGLLAEVRERTRVPLIALVRPRPGGFAYSDADFRVMLRDASALVAAGADGLAFGVLTPDGRVDVPRCGRLRDLCGGRAAVFHRAFDGTPDPFAALDTLIGLGFTRVMTSGQEATAYNGSARTAELIRRTAGRIEVLPAGGINRFTVADVVARTGCDQVHASLRSPVRDTSVLARPHVRFGSSSRGGEDWEDGTDERLVADLRSRLTGWPESADMASPRRGV